MARNIDQANAPTIDLTPEARDFGIVQGDNRALMGIRFRDPTSTEAAPAYDPIHASEWTGRILRARGGTENVPLEFSNVTFSYTSGGTLMTSNREVQVHIPWDNAMFSTVNPSPNRGVSFLYDIWELTYPDSQNSYITGEGDRLHFTRDRSRQAAIGEIIRLNDTTIEVRAPNAGALYNWNLGDLVWLSYLFDGAVDPTTQDIILGEVTGTGTLASGVETFDVSVISFDANNGVDLRTVPDQNVPDPFGGTLESGSIVEGLNPNFTTLITRPRFRGKINIRERISANVNAGNEDVNTNGG